MLEIFPKNLQKAEQIKSQSSTAIINRQKRQITRPVRGAKVEHLFPPKIEKRPLKKSEISHFDQNEPRAPFSQVKKSPLSPLNRPLRAYFLKKHVFSPANDHP